MVWSLTPSFPVKTLTKKPLVRWGLEEGLFAKGFSDMVVGLNLVGWIKKVMPYGVFVEFPGAIMGLAPKSVSVAPTTPIYYLCLAVSVTHPLALVCASGRLFSKVTISIAFIYLFKKKML